MMVLFDAQTYKMWPVRSERSLSGNCQSTDGKIRIVVEGMKMSHKEMPAV